MAKNRRSPLVVELIKGLIFLGFGVVLIVQPWLAAVSWLGWVILVAGALIALAMALRIRNARRMRAHVVAEFADGSAVYEKGLQIGGMLYDFSTFGAQIDGASFDGERLSFLYSYYAKRRGRAMEVVEIAVQPEEAEKARAVLEHLGLPEVETVQQQLEARKKALEDEKNAAVLEKRDR